MKTALNPEQIEQYQQEGWLIVDDFLGPDELDWIMGRTACRILGLPWHRPVEGQLRR